jgi:ABC-type nitrate/sulfonate/bicarbonate transport system substrate-binding protein
LHPWILTQSEPGQAYRRAFVRDVAFLPVYVSEDKGFFKDEGLDVLLVLFNAGATNLQALLGEISK